MACFLHSSSPVTPAGSVLRQKVVNRFIRGVGESFLPVGGGSWVSVAVTCGIKELALEWGGCEGVDHLWPFSSCCLLGWNSEGDGLCVSFLKEQERNSHDGYRGWHCQWGWPGTGLFLQTPKIYLATVGLAVFFSTQSTRMSWSCDTGSE